MTCYVFRDFLYGFFKCYVHLYRSPFGFGDAARHNLQHRPVGVVKSDLVVEIYPKPLNSARCWEEFAIWW